MTAEEMAKEIRRRVYELNELVKMAQREDSDLVIEYEIQTKSDRSINHAQNYPYLHIYIGKEV